MSKVPSVYASFSGYCPLKCASLSQGQYRFYLKRQAHDVRAFMQDEEILLSSDVDYASIRGLSYEVRERLERIRPVSIVRPFLSDNIVAFSIADAQLLFGFAGSREADGGHDPGISVASHWTRQEQCEKSSK
jgi:hypothetical protein